MTIAEFVKEHHTIISLSHGIIITFVVFKIHRIKLLWKIFIILITLLLLTGIMGVLKYLALAFSLGLILYTVFVSVFPFGIMVTTWLFLSHGVDLKWWQGFLICAVWGPVAMLLDVGIFYTMVLCINLLGMSSEILPKRFREKLDTFNKR